MREVTVQEGETIALPAPWSALILSLATFLCRSIDGSAITLAVSGSVAQPAVLLEAVSPVPLPPGMCDIFPLAAHFGDVPELREAAALAAQMAVTVSCRVESTAVGSRLSLIAEARPDPSRHGLKQPPALIARAGAEAGAEWCCRLRAALRAGG